MHYLPCQNVMIFILAFFLVSYPFIKNIVYKIEILN